MEAEQRGGTQWGGFGCLFFALHVEVSMKQLNMRRKETEVEGAAQCQNRRRWRRDTEGRGEQKVQGRSVAPVRT